MKFLSQADSDEVANVIRYLNFNLQELQMELKLQYESKSVPSVEGEAIKCTSASSSNTYTSKTIA